MVRFDPNARHTLIDMARLQEELRRISLQTRQALAGVPWVYVAGMRNFMIHEYDAADLGIVGHTVQDDLPGLIAKIEVFMPHEKE